MLKIVTVTLNPAFDSHYYLESFEARKENRVYATLVETGGKGLNTSRALCSAGVENTAVLLLGKENGKEFLSDLGDMDVRAIFVDGAIRNNITLHPDNDKETRVSLAGFAVGEDVLYEIENTVMPLVGDGTLLSFSGSLPQGISAKTVLPLLQRFNEKGARLVIDSSSFNLDDLVAAKAWLIKPNEQEIAVYLGEEIGDPDSALRAAQKIRQSGISNVMITLGDKGSAFAGENLDCTVTVPKIKVFSTIGAGDSAIAGFLAATKAGRPIKEAVALANAFGSAACLTQGTQPLRKQDVDTLLSQIKLNIKQ